MFTVSALFSRGAKLCYRTLRQVAYDDMFHQASDWIPEELRIERKDQTEKPIRLDFNIPKKNRLHWIKRTMQHLPH